MSWTSGSSHFSEHFSGLFLLSASWIVGVVTVPESTSHGHHRYQAFSLTWKHPVRFITILQYHCTHVWYTREVPRSYLFTYVYLLVSHVCIVPLFDILFLMLFAQFVSSHSTFTLHT